MENPITHSDLTKHIALWINQWHQDQEEGRFGLSLEAFLEAKLKNLYDVRKIKQLKYRLFYFETPSKGRVIKENMTKKEGLELLQQYNKFDTETRGEDYYTLISYEEDLPNEF